MGEVKLNLSTNLQELFAKLEGTVNEMRNLTGQTDAYNQRASAGFNKTAQSANQLKNDIKEQEKILKDMQRTAESYAKKQATLSDKEHAAYKRLQGDIKVANQELKGMKAQQEQVHASAGKGSEMFKKLGGAIVAAFSVNAIYNFAKSSIEAFDAQAKAEAKLLVAVRGRKDVQEALIQQAKDLQKTTRFGDEQTEEAQARLARLLGPNKEAILQLTPLIQDFATAQGMDLAQAANLVAKAYGTSTNALARYGISLKEPVGSTERLAELTRILNLQVGGQAVAAANTGIGAMVKLNNAWGDLKETIGGILAQSLNPVMEDIKNLIVPSETAYEKFNSLSDSIKNNKNNVIPLIDEYDKLKGKTNLSSDEQSRLNELIKAISKNIPSAITSFDAYGNAIDISSGKARDFVEAQKTLLKYQNQEAIKELTDGSKEIRSQLEDLQKKIIGGVNEQATTYLQDVFGKGPKKYTEEQLKLMAANAAELGTKLLNTENAIKILSGETESFAEAGTDKFDEEVRSLDLLKAKLDELKKEQSAAPGPEAFHSFDAEIKALEDEIALYEKKKDKVIKDKIDKREKIDKITMKPILKFDEDGMIQEVELFGKKVEIQFDKALGAMQIKTEGIAPLELKLRDEFKSLGEDYQKQVEKNIKFSEDNPLAAQLGFENQEQLDQMKDYAGQLLDFINQIVDQQVEAADRLVEEKQNEIDEQQSLVDKEYEFKKEGLANSYDIEAENLKKMQEQRDKAVKDREKMIAIQRTMATVESGISLVSAAANIIKGFSSIPIVGVVLGLAAVGAMIAGFILSTAKAKDAVKMEEGGEVGYGLLSGRRHSQGGIPINAEGGEYFTNRKSTSKYLPLLEAINKDDRDSMRVFFDRNFTSKFENRKEKDYSKDIHGVVNELRKNKPETIYGQGFIIEKSGGYTKKIYLS